MLSSLKLLTNFGSAALLVALLAGPPVLAVQSGGVSAYPSQQLSDSLIHDPYFHFRLGAGQSQASSITIVNRTPQQQSFEIYGVDGSETASGGLTMKNYSEPKHEVGKWLNLAVARVTLLPRESKLVPFSITIPRDAAVGDHVGGIVIQKDSPTLVTTNHTSLLVVTRLAVRLYESVPGQQHPILKLEDFSDRYSSGKHHYQVILFNSGNVTLYPRGAVTISSWLGKRQLAALPPMELLPHHRTTLYLPDNQYPLLLLDHKTARLKVTSAAPLLLAQRQGWEGNPWLLLGLGLLLLTAAVFTTRLRLAYTKRNGATS